MFVTPAIKNLIKSGDLIQVNNNIEMGSQEWMVTMRNFGYRLEQQGIIKAEDYMGYFTNDD
jgi:Tfp pilus assembly pilus retraction ATPase PilT